MAIRSPGDGPPGSGPQAPRGDIPKATRTKKASAKRRALPTQDEFDRIAESMAGNEDGIETWDKKRRVRGAHRVMSRAILKVDGELTGLQRDVSRLLEVLQSAGFSAVAFERHKREMARIRALIERARRSMSRARRGALEADSKLADVQEPGLARVERELDRLEKHTTEWGRALAAADLATEVSGGEEPRRLSVRGADREAAMGYAERSNPTTVVADLAASALRMTTAPGAVKRPVADGLGRSLDGQQLLERMINPEAGEDE